MNFKIYFAEKCDDEKEVDLKVMEQLMANNLSGSQLDLVLHGDGDPFAPGHVKPRQYDSKLRQRDTKHSRMFLESEKNGMPTIVVSQSNQFDHRKLSEPTTETSSL